VLGVVFDTASAAQNVLAVDGSFVRAGSLSFGAPQNQNIANIRGLNNLVN